MISYFRFLWRNRLYSTINLIGLTVALALSIIIFGYAAAQMKIARSVPGGKLQGQSPAERTFMPYA